MILTHVPRMEAKVVAAFCLSHSLFQLLLEIVAQSGGVFCDVVLL